MTIYEEIGLKRVINASGRMTALGVSTVSDTVASAMLAGAQQYVVVEDLMEQAGKRISQFTKAEDSCVTSSASAGICLSVAGVIARDHKAYIQQLPETKDLPNEIILQKGHVVQFGAPIETLIRMAGGVPKEAGMVNQVEREDIVSLISDKTVALLYVKSHHCIQKGMVSLEDMIAIAHEHHLPLLVDAAAEEDMRKYVAMGADLVIYSGAKALEAPTSGFVTGKKELISYVKKQYHGIGRPMKVGKEQVIGLLKAMEVYFARDHAAEAAENLAEAKDMAARIQQIDGLHTEIIKDEAGREIYRCKVVVEPSSAKSAQQVDEALKAGNPSIHCRGNMLAMQALVFDPRPLGKGDKECIIQRLKEIMEVEL